MNPKPQAPETPAQNNGADDKASSSVQDPSACVEGRKEGVSVRFFKSVDSGHVGGIYRLQELEKPKSYHDIIVKEASKIVIIDLIHGNKHLRCYLFRLPIHVRFMIYEFLFIHDGSPLEIGRLKYAKMGNLAILRTSHVIYHEASIALYHSMSYRMLFFRNYGTFSVDMLNRRPKSLPCCRNMVYETWLKYPCRSERLVWKRSIENVIFLVGAFNFELALRRRWAFAEFITTLRMGDPLSIYSLTIVATHHWKMLSEVSKRKKEIASANSSIP